MNNLQPAGGTCHGFYFVLVIIFSTTQQQHWVCHESFLRIVLNPSREEAAQSSQSSMIQRLARTVLAFTFWCGHRHALTDLQKSWNILCSDSIQSYSIHLYPSLSSIETEVLRCWCRCHGSRWSSRSAWSHWRARQPRQGRDTRKPLKSRRPRGRRGGSHGLSFPLQQLLDLKQFLLLKRSWRERCWKRCRRWMLCNGFFRCCFALPLGYGLGFGLP